MSNLERVSSGAIADLSYRNYDGPLESPNFRWWVIAKQIALQSMSKRSLWVLCAFGAWYYVIVMVVLFFMQQLSQTGGGAQAYDTLMARLIWKDQFLDGLSYAQLLLMIVTLVVGAGAIANDNRANALLVYLSKPTTRLDYMLGKWVGIFIPMFCVVAIPSVVFYGYGAFSFLDHGFIHDDPWLLPKLFVIFGLLAAFQTSVILALSSMFKQGRVAGAVYAGIYILSNLFSVIVHGVWLNVADTAPKLVTDLNYCSVDGLQIGLVKSILHTSGSQPIWGSLNNVPQVPAPPWWAMVGIVIVFTVVCMSFVWSRVRAVEVVG